jgi:RNA polymerase sigma factor (sigma-70 family)
VPLPSEFERDVLPHLDAAYNVARWLVRDPDLAQDVVQEAMLRALRYHAGLRGNAKPWLLQIVRNAAFAALATRRAQSGPTPAEPAADPVDPAGDPLSALERSDGIRHLNVAMATLPDELRECLVLRELEELSYKEIAQVTGVPIGTVMSRLWRARRALLSTKR